MLLKLKPDPGKWRITHTVICFETVNFVFCLQPLTFGSVDMYRRRWAAASAELLFEGQVSAFSCGLSLCQSRCGGTVSLAPLHVQRLKPCMSNGTHQSYSHV